MAQLELLCELEQGFPLVFHAPGVFPCALQRATCLTLFEFLWKSLFLCNI